MRWSFAILFALVYLAAEAPADEAAVSKFIEDVGGRITRDVKQPGKPVISVYLAGTPVTDADLAKLKELKKLTTLELTFTQVSDLGLKELKELKQLKHLDLRVTKVTDAGLKRLHEALPKCVIFPGFEGAAK